MSRARWRRSGLLWTLLVVACIEFAFARTLPGRYFRHEVDELLHEVNTRRYNARNLSLGNSVGRQLDRGIDKLEPGFLEPMSSNGSLETTGQYLVLRRYLERNPRPENLILWLDNPFAGSLHLIYTENYIQRCFVRWREIGLIGWWKGSPTFLANMVCYKLLPSYRYRVELQEELPFLEVARVMGNLQNAARARGGLGLRDSEWTRRWQRFMRDGQSISSAALERMLALCQARGIRVYLIPHADARTRGDEARSARWSHGNQPAPRGPGGSLRRAALSAGPAGVPKRHVSRHRALRAAPGPASRARISRPLEGVDGR